MTGEPVLYQVRDGVALIVLNRPKARNAINGALARALDRAFVTAQDDDAVGAIVVTGSDPAFTAGLDLKEFQALGRAPDGAFEIVHAAGQLSKPSIGAINGPAMTGALELALGFDFLIASERATFGDTHARVGILPAGGMTARLPRRVGSAVARELSLTSRTVDAAEALRIGLVNRVVPHESLVETALALGAAIASHPAPIVAEIRSLYDYSDNHTEREAVAEEVSRRNTRLAQGAGLVPKT